MSDTNFWGEPMSPCGDRDCRGGLVLIVHFDGYAYDTCNACEAYRRAQSTNYVHPDYPF